MPPQPRIYSYKQLEQLWVAAGGSKVLAPIAAAIAMAESGGNDQAVNSMDNGGRQTSWGLWQISNGTHSPPVSNILDPQVNARQAVAKYNAAGGWSPWGTFTSGAYQKFLQGGSTVSDLLVRGGQAFVDEASSFIGDPYVFGAAGPTTFDCSGLVQYALEKIGLKNVPRTSEQQWNWVKHISAKDLQPGDLIFEQWPGDNAPPGHVVIYAGNGQIIQAPHTGADVQLDSWSPGQVHAEGGRIVGYGRIPGLGKASTTAPAGSQQQPQQATLTSWLPGWAQGIGDVILGPLAPIFNIFQGPLDAIHQIANGLSVIEQGIAWLFIPSHWVRIFAGIFGTGFVVVGIVTMTRTGRGYEIQVPGVGQAPAPGGQLAPALGIAEVTVGGVLLFVAFHNLPPQVDTFGGFISHLQGELQRGGAQA